MHEECTVRAERTHLTDAAIRLLKPPVRGQRVHYDSLSPLALRISAGGTRTFFVLTGSGQRESIGAYPTITLPQARERARDILNRRALGVEPTFTFEEAFNLFLEKRAWNKERTKKDVERLIRQHFLPKFKRKDLAAIRTAEIIAILDTLSATPCEAAHAHAAIRLFFRWCKKRRYVTESPAADLEVPYRYVPRDRVLSISELAIVYRTAGEFGYPFGTIVQLLILTGQRRTEIGSLRREWTNDAEVRLPPEVVKNNREHVFPISSMVRDIFDGIPVDAGCLFPARGKDTPFNGWSASMEALRAKLNGIAHFTLHDLRRSFATGIAPLTHPHVVEKILNHISHATLSPIALIYNKYAYWEEQKATLAAWEANLAVHLASNVTSVPTSATVQCPLAVSSGERRRSLTGVFDVHHEEAACNVQMA